MDCRLAYCYERREGCILDFTGLVSGKQHNANLLEKKKRREIKTETNHNIDNVSRMINSSLHEAAAQGPENLAGKFVIGTKYPHVRDEHNCLRILDCSKLRQIGDQDYPRVPHAGLH